MEKDKDILSPSVPVLGLLVIYEGFAFKVTLFGL